MKAAVLYISLLIVFISLQRTVYSQQKDRAYIEDFDRPNAVEIYPGFEHSGFNFSNGKRSDRYVKNSGAYLGIYGGYKWLSFSYAVSIPSTFVRNDVKFNYSAYRFGFTKNSVKVRPFYTSYRGLLLKRSADRHIGKFTPVKEIHYQDAGVYIMHFFNRKKYSYDVANYFIGQQLKNTGSFFLIMKPSWQRLKWYGAVPATIKGSFKVNPEHHNLSWLSFFGGIGYNHVFGFRQGKWIISPLADVSVGAVKALNGKNNKVRKGIEINSGITAGYNGPTFYGYVNSTFKLTHSPLPTSVLQQTNTDVSVTVGYRFKNLRKKIAGYL